MKASDLPYGVRHQLLDQVRQQVGDGTYQRMTSELGEDGLLDLFLEKSAALAVDKPASEKPGCLGAALAGFASYWWLWIPALVGAVAGEDAGGSAFLICLGLLGIGWIVGWLARAIGGPSPRP